MAIDQSGSWWTGSGPEDLDYYLAAVTAESYPSARVVRPACGVCRESVFAVRLDDEEGCAVRTCVGCGAVTPMLDSASYLDDADLDDATCPCGGETFEVAVGFALYDDSDDVRWVYLALRCTTDGVLGCYSDWKIDYAPSDHLYDAV